MINYSETVWGNGQVHPQDMSRKGISKEEFLYLVNQAHANAWTHLQPGGYMLVMTGLLKRKGEIHVLADDMAKFGKQIARIIKVQKNATSNIKKANGGYGGAKFIATDHEEILIWQKEDRFFVVLSTTNFIKSDTRTWANILTWGKVAYETVRKLQQDNPSRNSFTCKEIYNQAQQIFPNKCNKKHLSTWECSLRRGLQMSKLLQSFGYDQWGLNIEQQVA